MDDMTDAEVTEAFDLIVAELTAKGSSVAYIILARSLCEVTLAERAKGEALTEQQRFFGYPVHGLKAVGE